MVGRAVRMAVDGSLDPLFYVYPPLAFDVFAVAEWVAGHLPGGRLGPATMVDPSVEYLAARSVSALAQVGSVAATAFAASRAYGARAGLVAAVALAVAPLAVREAHFATTDALQLALLAAGLWTATRATSAGGFALAGALAGATAATKYTGGAVLVYVVVLAVARRRWWLAAAAVVAAGSVFAALVVATGHLGDYPAGLSFVAGRAAGFASMPPGWLYHPTRSLPFGFGPGAYGLAVVGLAVAAWRRTPTDVALLAYLAAAFAPLAASHEVFFRYALPLLPALCLLAGRAVTAVPPRLAAPALLVAALLLVPSLWNSVEGDHLLGAPDTRAQAAAWLDANARTGSAVVVDNYWGEPFYSAADLPENRLRPYYVSGDRIADSFQQGRYTSRFTTAPSGSPCYRLAESGPPWQAPAPTGGLAGFTPGRPDAGAVYDPLDSFWLPIWGFEGLDRPGPAIAVVAC